jgi:2'-5' RNA ligase
MGALEVIARPEFGKADLDWLMLLRKLRTQGSETPAFTLVFPGAFPGVFPGTEAATCAVVKHVEAACAATSRIRFCLRSALVVPEHKMGRFHVFLVPDEGFGAIIRLHERLHGGLLAGCLRPDIPYIPHVTVASTREFASARHTMASLNAKGIAITGRIDEIEVQERDSTEPRCLARVPLARGGFFH